MNVVQECPVVEECGGCPLLWQSAAEERAIKVALLGTIGSDLKTAALGAEIITGRQRVGYRNRIRLRVDEGGKIGFFNSGKSPDCAILLPALRHNVALLREWSASQRALLAPFAHLEVRAPDRDGNSGLFLTRKVGAATSKSTVAEIASLLGNHWLAADAESAIPNQSYDIDGETYQRVPLNGFLQVNLEVNRTLTEHVVRGARQRGLKSFADLFCGSGNFALPLARAGLTGAGVERISTCRSAATRAAQQQGLDGVRFADGDAITTCRHWLAEGQHFDAVIIDPPRAGVREGLDVLMALARRSIVYCSCNPTSLTRDLRTLQAAGWQLEQLTGFDMFPGTVHLESVAWLSRH